MVSHNLAPAMAWFEACAADNTRSFWERSKQTYRDDVREPFLALLTAAGEHVPDWRIYRPHADTRFSPVAPPLKTFLGALRVDHDGTGRYLQIDANGLLASSGLPYFAPDQVPRWRDAVDRDGDALAALLDRARDAGGRVKPGYPEPLRRTPRGYDPAHRHGELLRWKGIEVFARDGHRPTTAPPHCTTFTP